MPGRQRIDSTNRSDVSDRSSKHSLYAFDNCDRHTLMRKPSTKVKEQSRTINSLPHNVLASPTPTDLPVPSRYFSTHKSQVYQTPYRPSLRRASQADVIHSRFRAWPQDTQRYHQHQYREWWLGCWIERSPNVQAEWRVIQTRDWRWPGRSDC
jgi:hypothetical protein